MNSICSVKLCFIEMLKEYFIYSKNDAIRRSMEISLTQILQVFLNRVFGKKYTEDFQILE